MSPELRHRWHGLLRQWRVDPARAEHAYEQIRQLYAQGDRHYHTLQHIQDVLERIDELASLAACLEAIQLAAWLHDVVYDPRAKDNEERSADYAAGLCQQLAIPLEQAVRELILKTKTHDPGGDRDACILLDADLAILGADPPAYRAYADAIRCEFASVPEDQYRAGRRRVLAHFLDRPRIYHLLTNLEEPARRNIGAEIERLGHDPLK